MGSTPNPGHLHSGLYSVAFKELENVTILWVHSTNRVS